MSNTRTKQLAVTRVTLDGLRQWLYVFTCTATDNLVNTYKLELLLEMQRHTEQHAWEVKGPWKWDFADDPFFNGVPEEVQREVVKTFNSRYIDEVVHRPFVSREQGAKIRNSEFYAVHVTAMSADEPVDMEAPRRQLPAPLPMVSVDNIEPTEGAKTWHCQTCGRNEAGMALCPREDCPHHQFIH